jgi:site-specific DNA-cytosine methylase
MTAVAKQVGNAVAPRLATRVAELVAAQLDDAAFVQASPLAAVA